MTQVTETIFIDADDHQFVVREKKKVQEKESKKYGEEYWDNLGHFKNIENAVEYIELVLLRRKIATKDMPFNKIPTVINKIHKDITKIFKEEK